MRRRRGWRRHRHLLRRGRLRFSSKGGGGRRRRIHWRTSFDDGDEDEKEEEGEDDGRCIPQRRCPQAGVGTAVGGRPGLRRKQRQRGGGAPRR